MKDFDKLEDIVAYMDDLRKSPTVFWRLPKFIYWLKNGTTK